MGRVHSSIFCSKGDLTFSFRNLHYYNPNLMQMSRLPLYTGGYVSVHGSAEHVGETYQKTSLVAFKTASTW